MKVKKLIKLLQQAEKDYGDVPVKLMDYLSSNWRPIKIAMRHHPYTLDNGVMNREEPVNSIGLSTVKPFAEDLIINP